MRGGASSRSGRALLLTAVCVVTACGGSDDSAEPSSTGHLSTEPSSTGSRSTEPAEADDEAVAPLGDPVLPDLTPQPAVDVHTKRQEEGVWTLTFSSELVNVGDGEFLLRATRERDDDAWAVEQPIRRSISGVDVAKLDAPVVWGGDGHDHWHIARVATNWLVPLDDAGEPVEGADELVDTKVGFCFYDLIRVLDTGPEEVAHDSEGCGHEDDEYIEMGLSPGWSDVYEWNLPGQTIDITDVADGRYRLWTEADESGWFREQTRDNNLTWVDLELGTIEGELRTAFVLDVGPQPAPASSSAPGLVITTDSSPDGT